MARRNVTKRKESSSTLRQNIEYALSEAKTDYGIHRNQGLIFKAGSVRKRDYVSNQVCQMSKRAKMQVLRE